MKFVTGTEVRNRKLDRSRTKVTSPVETHIPAETLVYGVEVIRCTHIQYTFTAEQLRATNALKYSNRSRIPAAEIGSFPEDEEVCYYVKNNNPGSIHPFSGYQIVKQWKKL